MSTKLKLAVGTAALAVGVLAPAASAAVAASTATPFVFWFGQLAVGFGQWVASYYNSRKASADEAAEQAQIPDAQTLLGNEHLTALLGLAFRAAIQRASDAAEVATHRADLRAMARAAPGELQRALASEAERFSALRESAVPEIVIRAQRGGGPAPFLELAEWRELLVPLAERVGANPASGRWVDRVATIVEAAFPTAFKEILKRDRHPNGPTQGRGYAAYEMMIATRILTQLNAADVAATDRFGELIKQVWDTENRLRERLEMLQRDQKSTHAGVESIRRLLEHGLNSFDAFREFYWSQVRKQKLLAELWKQPRLATMLEHRFVGRADLVRSVVEMLTSGSKDAVLLFGAPGFGKSRLLLAIAEDVRRAGVEVAFIHRSVHDLRSQLSRFEGQRGTVLLVWDDIHEASERDAKFFFELDDPSFAARYPRFVRLAATWPGPAATWRQNFYLDDCFQTIEVPNLEPDEDEWVRWLGVASPALADADRRQLVRLSGANPMVLLAALSGLERGAELSKLTTAEEILARSYGGLIRKVLDVARDHELVRGLRIIAALGVIDNANKHVSKLIDTRLSTALDALASSSCGLVRIVSERWELQPDHFALWVLRNAVRDDGQLRIMRAVETMALELAPFAIEFLPRIWSITASALSQDATRRLRDALWAQVRQFASDFDEESATRMARSIVDATVVEPSAAERARLANEIGKLRERHDTAEIALEQATALCSATYAGPSIADCVRLANEIRALCKRLDTAEIAWDQASTLSIATFDERAAVSAPLLSEIGKLIERQDMTHVAFRYTMAVLDETFGGPSSARARAGVASDLEYLMFEYDMTVSDLDFESRRLSSTVGELSTDVHANCARTLRKLLKRHRNAEIALKQAMALIDATLSRPSSAECARIASDIGKLGERHDTAEIALEQATALVSATFCCPSSAECARVANEIGELRKRHDTAEIALEQAFAMRRAAFDEPSSAKCERAASEIGKLRERHDTAEIALEQARALCGATTDESSAADCLQVASELGKLRERHDTAEIALEQAKALRRAVFDSSLAERARVVGEIRKLRERHDTAEIALEQARALNSSMTAEDEWGDVRMRLRKLFEFHDTAEIASERANSTTDERLAAECSHAAREIGELRERHDTADIALEQARALYNATVGEPSAAERARLANEIGKLRERHDTAEIAEVHRLAMDAAPRPDA